MFPDLRSFIAALGRDRDLVEIDAPVDAHLEVAEIHRRVIAAGGPALLFTNVRGKAFPLVTNLFESAFAVCCVRTAGLTRILTCLDKCSSSQSDIRAACLCPLPVRRRCSSGVPSSASA